MNTVIRNFIGVLIMGTAAAAKAQFEYVTNAGGTSVTITGYSSNGPLAVIIPPSVDGLTVTSIGNSAFFGTDVTDVTIPDSVTNIGEEAFDSCSSLTNVAIPGSVTSIGEFAFLGTDLTSVAIPDGVTDITEGAFEGCLSLTNVAIPGSVTNVGEYAFAEAGLTSVTIPDSVTNIGAQAFGSCSSLTNVEIPDSVVSIGYGAFVGSGLTSVTIPGSVTNIGQGAIAGCPNLTNVTIAFGVPYIASNMFAGCPLAAVTIPGSVTNIEEYAFQDCIELTQVYFTGNAPTVDWTVFDDYGRAPSSEVDTNYYVATAYYLPGTTGWAEFTSNTLVISGSPGFPTDSFPTNMFVATVLWNPVIQATGADFGVRGGQFGFDITGTTNIPIVVEACTNLAQPVWAPLQSMTLTNGLVHFSEPVQTNIPARFYRIGAP